MTPGIQDAKGGARLLPQTVDASCLTFGFCFLPSPRKASHHPICNVSANFRAGQAHEPQITDTGRMAMMIMLLIVVWRSSLTSCPGDCGYTTNYSGFMVRVVSGFRGFTFWGFLGCRDESHSPPN